MDMSVLTAAEFMIGMYLNFDPAQDPAGMTITDPDARASAGISSGIDCCKRDGQGDHDVQIDFPQAAVDRFTGGEAYTGMLMLDGILATDFEFLSSTGNCAIARAQCPGAGAAESGWLDRADEPAHEVEEPGSLAPFGLSAPACPASLVAAAETVKQHQEFVVLRRPGATTQDKMPPLRGGFSLWPPKHHAIASLGGSVQADRKKKPPYSGVSS